MPILPNLNIDKVTNKFAKSYFVSYTKKYDTKEILKAKEIRKRVKAIRIRIITISALYGTLGVLFLFLPQYFSPSLFPKHLFKIPIINYTFSLSISELIYGVFLTALEIWLLALTDFRSVSRIAAVYDFEPDNEQKNKAEETLELVNICLGKDKQKMKEVGINPLQKTSKTSIVLLLILYRAKAFLSRFIVRFIIKKILGRLAVRAVLDMLGIPIYAFWNAFAASEIMRKANMRMHAHKLMYQTGAWFHERFSENSEFKNLVYDTLQYIAIEKKSFYPTDYLFVKHFLQIFEVPIVKEHILSDNYIAKIKSSSNEIKDAMAKFIIIGFLIDGKLGSLEIRALNQLKDEGIVPWKISQIKIWMKEYLLGHGFWEMLNTNSLEEV